MRQAMVLLGCGVWLHLIVFIGLRSDAREAASEGERSVPRWARVLGAKGNVEDWQRDGREALRAMRFGAWVLVLSGTVVFLLAAVR